MKRCFNCDIELPDAALTLEARDYCCAGCSVGGPCCCTYESQTSPRPTNGHADPLLTRELLGSVIDRVPEEGAGLWD